MVKRLKTPDKTLHYLAHGEIGGFTSALIFPMGSGVGVD